LAAKQNLNLRKEDLHPMRRLIPINEQYPHFVADLKHSFWGGFHGQVRRFFNEALERESIRSPEAYFRLQPRGTHREPPRPAQRFLLPKHFRRVVDARPKLFGEGN
jgi:hypothetical protein